MLNHKCYDKTLNGAASSSEIPLIMLHGLLGSSANWNYQAKALSRYQTVITVDLRNHGESPHVKGMSYREMSDDIIALLNHLAIKKCLLMGHSMGGKVAMTLALTYPQYIEKLIVVDIAPKAYTPRHHNILQGMMRLPLADIKNRKQADLWLSDWVLTNTDRGFLLKNLKRNAKGYYWQCNLAEIVKNYLKISGFSVDKNTQYHKPTLFIGGGQSDYIQVEDHGLIQQHFPLSTIQMLEHSGHLPHVEESEKFRLLLEEFLLNSC